MRMLFDQSAVFRLIPRLRSLGHDVTAVSQDYAAGLVDEAVLAIAYDEERLLLTADLDFGDLVIRRRLRHHDVLLMRLPGASLQDKVAALDRVLREHESDVREFLVVTERNIRIRRSR